MTPGHQQITVSWQAVPRADTYELWTWQEGGAWEQLGGGSLTATSFTHSNLTVGAKHYYAIRALNNDGAEGAWSEYVGALAAGELPTPVLTAAAGPAQVAVTWQAVTGANAYELWYWVDGSRLGPARRRRTHRHHLHPYRPHLRHHLLLQPPRPTPTTAKKAPGPKT